MKILQLSNIAVAVLIGTLMHAMEGPEKGDNAGHRESISFPEYPLPRISSEPTIPKREKNTWLPVPLQQIQRSNSSPAMNQPSKESPVTPPAKQPTSEQTGRKNKSTRKNPTSELLDIFNEPELWPNKDTIEEYWMTQKLISLIKQNAKINATTALGKTPLFIAITNNNEKVVKLLLTNGANPSQEIPGNINPLYQALHQQQPTIASLLIGRGAQIPHDRWENLIGELANNPQLWTLALNVMLQQNWKTDSSLTKIVSIIINNLNTLTPKQRIALIEHATKWATTKWYTLLSFIFSQPLHASTKKGMLALLSKKATIEIPKEIKMMRKNVSVTQHPRATIVNVMAAILVKETITQKCTW